eukprot:1149626-Pelagomonas_calceolata.AAC.3
MRGVEFQRKPHPSLVQGTPSTWHGLFKIARVSLSHASQSYSAPVQVQLERHKNWRNPGGRQPLCCVISITLTFTAQCHQSSHSLLTPTFTTLPSAYQWEDHGVAEFLRESPHLEELQPQCRDRVSVPSVPNGGGFLGLQSSVKSLSIRKC